MTASASLPPTGATDATQARAARDGHGGRLVAGVDVGGTKAAALVADEQGTILGRAERAMERGDGPASVEPVFASVRAALEAASASPSALAAVGVGVPGRVDSELGVVRVATNLGWNDVPLGRAISEAFGTPSAVENDVRLAAAGLVGHPLADGALSLAYLAVGTGIGAGIVLGGRLHRGDRGMAGEIGHVIVEPDGAVCSCGQRGCLETIASGPWVARRASEELASSGESSALRGTSPLTAKAVYDAAREGDLLALRVTAHAGAVLARSIAGLVMTCDLERVLLGGGVSAAGAVFLAPIEDELAQLRARSPLVAQLLPPGAVRLLPAHFDAVALGGVALARRVLHEIPIPAEEEEEVVARESQP